MDDREGDQRRMVDRRLRGGRSVGECRCGSEDSDPESEHARDLGEWGGPSSWPWEAVPKKNLREMVAAYKNSATQRELGMSHGGASGGMCRTCVGAWSGGTEGDDVK